MGVFSNCTAMIHRNLEEIRLAGFIAISFGAMSYIANTAAGPAATVASVAGGVMGWWWGTADHIQAYNEFDDAVTLQRNNLHRTWRSAAAGTLELASIGSAAWAGRTSAQEKHGLTLGLSLFSGATNMASGYLHRAEAKLATAGKLEPKRPPEQKAPDAAYQPLANAPVDPHSPAISLNMGMGRSNNA